MEPIAMVEPSTSHLNRGRTFERAGRYSEAAAEYQEAAELDPSDVDAQLRLGLVLRVLGRDEEANEAFRAALDLRAGVAD